MLFDFILILFGLLTLFYGADWLVKGAARLASSFGVSPLVIGLTLVAFGTSTPELLVSILAALRRSSDIALGNVVGSNIANIGLILGLTAMIFPVVVHSQVMRRELPMMLGFSALTYALLLDRVIGRLDGLFLFVILVLFNVLTYRLAQQATARHDAAAAEFEEFEELEGLISDDEAINQPVELGRTVVGIVILVIGAQSLVSGATSIARAFGISELVIGITLVAFGTSLPELATSMVAAFRDEDDISVGNIVGSNIYNLLAVLGITALVRPISVAPSVLRLELPVMLAFSFILWPLIRDNVLARWQGALLFVGYILFTLFLFAG
ncbi:MAG: calcium/sodium antiporter [Chloroflexota bacterium]|nr:calcium/sodium antiporter [Chloroflexota bacterium]